MSLTTLQVALLSSPKPMSTLRAECKAKGFKGYSAFTRSQLVEFLASDGHKTAVTPKPATPIDPNKPLTAAQCRVNLKSRGLAGYSALSVDQLREYVKTGIRPTAILKAGSTPALRAECKALVAAGVTAVKGYSRLNRAELTLTIRHSEIRTIAGSTAWLHQLGSQYGIKGQSSMSRQRLINALSDTAAVDALLKAGIE